MVRLLAPRLLCRSFVQKKKWGEGRRKSGEVEELKLGPTTGACCSRKVRPVGTWREWATVRPAGRTWRRSTRRHLWTLEAKAAGSEWNADADKRRQTQRGRVTFQDGLLLLRRADEAADALDHLALGVHVLLFGLLSQEDGGNWRQRDERFKCEPKWP